MALLQARPGGTGAGSGFHEYLENPNYSPDGKIILPRYWRDPRFGVARRGTPVVGVTWWEAMAYSRWLQEQWSDLDEGSVSGNPTAVTVRLPPEAEWITAAGGEGEKKDSRYPWSTTTHRYAAQEEVLQQALTYSRVGSTAPPRWVFSRRAGSASPGK